jgi:hypothetical protein
MTVASEIILPKWQLARPACQNGSLSKSHAKSSAKSAEQILCQKNNFFQQFFFFDIQVSNGKIPI